LEKDNPLKRDFKKRVTLLVLAGLCLLLTTDGGARSNLNGPASLPGSDTYLAVTAPAPAGTATFAGESSRVYNGGAFQYRHFVFASGHANPATGLIYSELFVTGVSLPAQSGLALSKSGRSPPLPYIWL
jgi:hypothetical protein